MVPIGNWSTRKQLPDQQRIDLERHARGVLTNATVSRNSGGGIPLSVSASDGIDAGNTIVEVEFEVTDPQYPLVALSEETGCEAELLQLLPRSDGSYTVFQRITGAPPERVLEFARSYDGFDA